MCDIDLDAPPAETELARKAISDDDLHDLASTLVPEYDRSDKYMFGIVIGCMRLRGATQDAWHTVVAEYEDLGVGQGGKWGFSAHQRDLNGRAVTNECRLPSNISFAQAISTAAAEFAGEVEVRLLGRFAYDYTLLEYVIFMKHFTRRVKPNTHDCLPGDPIMWLNPRQIETHRIEIPGDTTGTECFHKWNIDVVGRGQVRTNAEESDGEGEAVLHRKCSRSQSESEHDEEVALVPHPKVKIKRQI
jgi:hypothetical protein